MYKVLVTSNSFAKFSKKPVDYLEENGCTVHYADKVHLHGSELAQMIKGYDGLIVGIDQVNREVIEAADKLKVICMHGTGLDHIDVQAATEKGIFVGNAPGGNGTSVAELTVGLILSAARNIVSADASIRKLGWERKLGTELTGKTVGFIGLGNIGKRVAELLSGFKMKFLAYDKFQDLEFAQKARIEYVELEELLTQSDVVTLHIPLTNETNHLISHHQLNLMKPGAILVNTSRGALVDDEALSEVLKKKRIAAAALDAFIHEPLEEDSELRDLDNIVLTPHIGASTYDAVKYVDDVNARTVVSVLTGKNPFSVVNADSIRHQVV